MRHPEAEAATAAVAALVRAEHAAAAAAAAHLPPFQFGLDFVVERGSGAAFCLECNPRCTNGAALLLCDAAAAAAAAAALLGPVLGQPTASPSGATPLATVPEGLAVRTSLAAAGALAAARGRGEPLRAAARRLLSARDDIFQSSDPRPALALLLALLRLALAHLAARCGRLLLRFGAAGRCSRDEGEGEPEGLLPGFSERVKARLAGSVVTYPPDAAG